MTPKQNFIFFFGLFLIILQWYVSGHLHTLTAAIFTGPANSLTPSSVAKQPAIILPSGQIPLPVIGAF